MYAAVSHAGIGALGQAEWEKWYRRAKASVEKFEAVLVRIPRIANKESRDDLAKRVGTEAIKNSPMAYYAIVRDAVRFAEKATPVNVLVWQEAVRRRHVEELEKMTKDLDSRIRDAEKRYGFLPEPEIRYVIVDRPIEKIIEKPVERVIEKIVKEEPKKEEGFLGLPTLAWLLIGGGAAVGVVIWATSSKTRVRSLGAVG